MVISRYLRVNIMLIKVYTYIYDVFVFISEIGTESEYQCLILMQQMATVFTANAG